MSKEWDNFMKKFKYYKSNKPKPSLEQVITPQNEKYNAEVDHVHCNSLLFNLAFFYSHCKNTQFYAFILLLFIGFKC